MLAKYSLNHSYLNTTFNTETFCVQQVTNTVVWGLTYLIICCGKCIQVGANVSAAYAINWI